MTTGAGPRPWWNGVGFGLAALSVTLFVVLFVPPAPQPPVETIPTSTTAGRTITLDDLADELEAQLTDSPGAPPPTVRVETPDGPVTVVVPTTSTSTTTTTTTTQPATTTTVVDRPRVPNADDLLDDLLGRHGGDE